jgi:hypothetical protein
VGERVFEVGGETQGGGVVRGEEAAGHHVGEEGMGGGAIRPTLLLP